MTIEDTNNELSYFPLPVCHYKQFEFVFVFAFAGGSILFNSNCNSLWIHCFRSMYSWFVFIFFFSSCAYFYQWYFQRRNHLSLLSHFSSAYDIVRSYWPKIVPINLFVVSSFWHKIPIISLKMISLNRRKTIGDGSSKFSQLFPSWCIATLHHPRDLSTIQDLPFAKFGRQQYFDILICGTWNITFLPIVLRIMQLLKYWTSINIRPC